MVEGMTPLMRIVSPVAVSAALVVSTGAAMPANGHPGNHGSYSWTLSPTGSTARLRGLSAVSAKVAWASGTGGTVLRTTDGGATWASVGPPDAATLQLRDIEATSASHAVALSIGEGEDSRVYVTDDGGSTWTESFRNHEATAFYDCMAFFNDKDGLALSDPVDGRFRLIRTSDAGHSWSIVDNARMPSARPGEFAFAASGTCLTTGVGHRAYIGSGGVNPGRIYSSTDAGATWGVQDSPIAGGDGGGVFSVRFRDARWGIALGGDFTNPTGNVDNAAFTQDGGATWEAAAGRTPGGYRSGSAWVAGTSRTAIAVGPTGSDVSTDGGRSWAAFDSGSFDSVECAQDGACWASGAKGHVARLSRS